MATYIEAREAAIRLIECKYTKSCVSLDMCVFELERYDPLVIDAVIKEVGSGEHSAVSFDMVRDLCALKSREHAMKADMEWQKSLVASQSLVGTLVDTVA